MADELDPRLLRYFVAVAEELHFSRAAEKLFVAQQALSRDIRRLEDRLGIRLLDRSTRRVQLTSAGQQLLVRARELIALHDRTVRELRVEQPSLVVDVVARDLTPAAVLEAARGRAPELEFIARFRTGTESAIPLIGAGDLDVGFGREPRLPAGLNRQPVRYEPLAVLLPEDHRLAALSAVPLEGLRDSRVCSRAGDHVTAGWEQAVLQLLEPFGVDPRDGHPQVLGGDELAQHVRLRNAPVLTLMSQPPVAGAVLRPLVEPVALYPWAMFWRADLDHPALRALREAAAALAAEQGWLTIPEGAWLPSPEAAAFSRR